MWRLKHVLFGWHYVSVEFGGKHHILRVMRDGNDQPYVRICGEHINLKTTRREWFSLTCNSGFIRA